MLYNPEEKHLAHNNGCHLLSTCYVPDTIVEALHALFLIFKGQNTYYHPHFTGEETEVQEVK